jgi:hypothetical protein
VSRDRYESYLKLRDELTELARRRQRSARR